MTNDTLKKAVMLFSGGVDSSTMLAMHYKEYEIHALSFNYLQRHDIELAKAREFIRDYGVKQHRIVNIDLRSFGGSALTDEAINVPKYEAATDVKDNIPITYVPARNTIFLSYALGFAEIIGARDIFIGAQATDYANYPDCRPEFIQAFEQLANVATAVGAQGQKIRIHAPLIAMTKKQVVATGLKLGVDYSKTISCYDPNEKGESCSKCLACVIRLKAFEENTYPDPISYVDA